MIVIRSFLRVHIERIVRMSSRSGIHSFLIVRIALVVPSRSAMHSVLMSFVASGLEFQEAELAHWLATLLVKECSGEDRLAFSLGVPFLVAEKAYLGLGACCCRVSENTASGAGNERAVGASVTNLFAFMTSRLARWTLIVWAVCSCVAYSALVIIMFLAANAFRNVFLITFSSYMSWLMTFKIGEFFSNPSGVAVRKWTLRFQTYRMVSITRVFGLHTICASPSTTRQSLFSSYCSTQHSLPSRHF